MLIFVSWPSHPLLSHTLPVYLPQISPGTHLELGRLWLSLQSHATDPRPKLKNWIYWGSNPRSLRQRIPNPAHQSTRPGRPTVNSNIIITVNSNNTSTSSTFSSNFLLNIISRCYYTADMFFLYSVYSSFNYVRLPPQHFLKLLS